MSAVSARSVSHASGVDRVRALQRVLYRCAKQDQDRRFHALYDKVARSDVMRRAWREVRANRGAAGVDGVTIDDIVARGVGDFLDELAAIAARLKDFKFVPALSHAAADDKWDGESGFVHEVVLRHLRAEKLTGAIDAYACGPTPMIDAVLPILQMNGVEPEHIYFDKFTPAMR